MSFLDNLEDNLKALESREEKDPQKAARDEQSRQAQRQAALAAAPYAEALKKGPFTAALLAACRTLGHSHRVLVRFTWLENILRLDAGSRRLELRPTPQGVEAVYFESGEERRREIIGLEDSAQDLARKWLVPA